MLKSIDYKLKNCTKVADRLLIKKRHEVFNFLADGTLEIEEVSSAI